MKKNITIAILLLTVTALTWYVFNQASNIKRIRHNWIADVQELSEEREVTQRELRQVYDIAEELQVQLSLKPKQIIQYLETPVQWRDTGSTVIHTHRDTVLVYPDSITGLVSKPCYDLNILLLRGQIYTDLDFKDTLKVVMYRRRPHRLWFIRYGRWINDAAVISECRDTVYIPTQNIKVRNR
jgi:hypothetical protein